MQDMKLQDMKLEDKQRKSSNRDYIRMQFLLLFSKHVPVKCTRRDVYSLKKRQCIVVHYKQFIVPKNIEICHRKAAVSIIRATVFSDVSYIHYHHLDVSATDRAAGVL